MEEDVINELNAEIAKCFESLKSNLGKLRTGRANIAILDGVRVDYYGTPTALSQCANLSVPDARMLTVKPWDRSIIGDIERAIQQAGIGITPQNDGEVIRLPIPALTEERRKDLVKQARAKGEEAKIAIRNHRRDSNEMLKEAEKDKELSQDDLKRALDKVQAATDKGISGIDEMLTGKEAEILEI